MIEFNKNGCARKYFRLYPANDPFKCVVCDKIIPMKILPKKERGVNRTHYIGYYYNDKKLHKSILVCSKICSITYTLQVI